MSYSPLTLLGLIGVIAFSITSYLNYRVYSRMKRDKELTIEFMFLRDQIQTALRALIIANLLFLASSGITIIGVYINNLVISQAFRLGSAALFIAYMSFFLAIYIWTLPEGLKAIFSWAEREED